MAGKIRLSFHSRVLFTVLSLCWLLIGIVMIFQYSREKEFKTEILNIELQQYNDRILEQIRQGGNIDSIIKLTAPPIEGLRLTLIDSSGQVIYDNNDKTPFPTTNHSNRPEIKTAREKGRGFAVERYSESDNETYFYSASKSPDGTILRSAAPYTHSLKEFLQADSSLLWSMTAITLVISVIAFITTHKISTSIMRLNRFAEKAEKGEKIFNDEAFPNDELGSIAGHIVRLYIQRDRQHREALRQEQDKIRLKKQLTNNINHELKTPVASILVCLELLRDHPELPEGKKTELNSLIYTNAQRLSTLLKDISTITRMDDGPEMIQKENVNIYEIITDIVAGEQLRTDMKITVSVPRLTVNGNRQLLESIFRNLIDNAISYSGGTEIKIIADNEGNFTVSDNGTGIPEDCLPHIFERFYRIDKGRSRATGGTGLGLSIVRNAVAMHGGRITVANKNGLIFRFRIS